MKGVLSGSAMAACLLVGTVTSAGAQQPPPPPVNAGPMTIERIQSGFLVEPEAKATEFDKRVLPLVGVSAGWLYDRTFFVGGAGYALVDNNRDRDLSYGGVVVGWQTHGRRPVHVGARILLGGGRATLDTTVSEAVQPRIDIDPKTGRPIVPTVPPTPTFTNVTVRVRDDFFVAEPEVNASVRLARHVRLSGGVGYRAVGSSRFLSSSRLRGATATVGLQVGGGV